ncbi:MAG TPA: N-acetylmuramic acid 6-phosphate etherase [Anaerolineae bacterium]|nr:N-acetylmuramic acid 6-phosphate etherase [Anaerolineae bacterium]
MSGFVIGVDGGGSKTEAVLLDWEGRELGRGRGGSSNWHLVGRDAARDVLAAVMAEAATAAGVDLARVQAVTWALAGAGRPAEADALRSVQAELLPHAVGQVVTDALAALVGGVGARFGVVAISGTGMMVYGENGPDIQARAGGWGHLLDEGSGYAIAMHALRAIARVHDHVDALPTQLTQSLLAALGLHAPQQLIPWLYAPERRPAHVAALAPLVLDAAEAGDLLAMEGMLRAADALAAGVDAVARQLALKTPFPLVLSGGLLTGNAFYRAVVAQSIRTRVPAARPMLPQADAATGAALLALAMLGRTLPPRVLPSSDGDGVWASEQPNVLTHELDRRSALELAGLMHLEDGRAVASMRPVLPQIATAIDAIAARMKQGGRLIYVGAGTSGRLGVLDASECPPTFNTAPGQVVGIIAGGPKALTEAVEEAEDDPNAGAQDIQALDVGPLDSVVGIAASGRTPYVVGALTEARRRGALTLALICNLPAPLAQIAEHVIAPLVGPEVIAGSTRLKAGTVQKLALNMLSTGVMVQLGKTYGNLMVDLRQQNVKLQRRARRIVAQACQITEEEAAQVLAQSRGDVKVAIVSYLLGIDPEAARRRLQQAEGYVRKALLSRDASE